MFTFVSLKSLVLRAAALAFVVLPTAPIHAQRPWIEVRSPNFVVMSEGDERAARWVAWQFEQIRLTLVRVWPWADAHTDRPFHIFALRSEDAMRNMAPGFYNDRNTPGPPAVLATSPDRHYVALRSDVVWNDLPFGRANPYQGAYWSYAWIVLERSLRRLPLWLSYGLASVMSNTVVTDGSLRVGLILVPSLRTLSERGRIPLADFVAVDRASSWYTDAERRNVFSAQAGTFVHFLMFSNKGARRKQLHEFIAAVRNGRPQDEPLRTIFGDLGVLEKEYALYVRDQCFQYMTLPAETSVRRDTFTARTLDAAESATRRAGFHAALRREVEARSLLENATKLSPNLAEIYEVDGLLLDAKGDTQAARQTYGRAIAAGSSNFYVKYRWASLTWMQSGIDDAARAAVRQGLQDAASLNGRYLPTFVLLSSVHGRLGAFAESVSAARTAVTLDPESVPNRLALAAALWNAAARDEARRVTGEAMTLATTDSERRSVNELIAFMDRP